MGWLLEITRGVAPFWKVFLFGMLPISELRGAIPYALFVEKMPWLQAYLVSVLGNAVPVLPLLLLLGPIDRSLGRWRPARLLLDWLFARTRRKGKLIDRFKILGLMIFVGIPLPVTGAWTGAVAAYVFGVEKKRAFPAILLGILLAGIVVTLACKGILGVDRFFEDFRSP